MLLSAVILTKNEEINIKRCIDALKFCDEVVVIDDLSTDSTVKIAERSGAVVYSHALDGDFASQRNFGLQKAQGNWVLFVDADEIVDKSLAAEIANRINNPPRGTNAFYLKREDVFRGKKLKFGETSRVRLLRLGRRNAGKWERKVHETWQVFGRKGQLKNALKHDSHPSVFQFVDRINYYSSIHARSNHEEGKRSSLFKIVLYPTAKFVENWIIRGGFLDGTPGLFVASMMSFHSFLSWSKLWLIQHQRE